MTHPRQLAPDLRGCEIHGLDDWTEYHYPGRAPYGRCLACQRPLQRKGPGYNGVRCVNGHLKTAWTWVQTKQGTFYCKTCQTISAKRRYDEQRDERLRRAREYYLAHRRPRSTQSDPEDESLAS